QRRSRSTTGRGCLALDLDTTASITTLRSVFRGNRFVRNFVAGAHADTPTQRRVDWAVLYLVCDFSDRDRIFPRTRRGVDRSLHAGPVLFVLLDCDRYRIRCRGQDETDVSKGKMTNDECLMTKHPWQLFEHSGFFRHSSFV